MVRAGPEHVYLSTNGVTLHAAVAGPEDGPLVVLLHGFPEFWYAWRAYLGPLAEAGYRVVAPDQRGYNLSDKPARVEAYRLDTLAADVAGLIEGQGRKQAFVVGHDWGAGVAWWTGLRHPERVAKLVALNVPHPAVMRARLLGGDLGQLRRSWYMFFFQLPWLPERAFAQDGGRRMFQRIRDLGRAGAFTDADEAAYVSAWRQAGAARGMIDWYRAAQRDAFGDWPEDVRISVPAHVVWGRQDSLLDPSLVDSSFALCDGPTDVTWFDEATHWVHHEESAAVLEVLRRELGQP